MLMVKPDEYIQIIIQDSRPSFSEKSKLILISYIQRVNSAIKVVLLIVSVCNAGNAVGDSLLWL